MAFIDPMRAIAAGQQFVDQAANNIYNRQAARGLATGSYGQALSALGNTGNIEAVAKLQDLQTERQQAQVAQQDQDIGRQVAFSMRATQVLRKALTEGSDPVAAYDSLAPAFQQVGATPEQIQQYRSALAADPANFLTNIERVTADAERKLNFQKAGDSVLVFEEGNPDPLRTFEASRRPIISGGVSFDPTTGQPIADTRRPEYIEVEGADGRPQIVAIGGGGPEVVFEGEARGPEVTTLTPSEVSSLGLQPGVYQRKSDGTISAVSGQGGDRLSAGQQRQVESYYQEIAGLDNIDSELGRFDRMIASGQLQLGPVSNAVGGLRNAVGASSENSRNLAEFRSTLERVRNDSLRLNSGVQTEGDAQRAWNELVSNINDPAVVRQQLRRIQGINERARRFRQQRIDALEGGAQRSSGAQPSVTPRVRFQPTSAQNTTWQSTPRTGAAGTRSNPTLINPSDPSRSFNNVPRGGYFITPDGQLRGPKP